MNMYFFHVIYINLAWRFQLDVDKCNFAPSGVGGRGFAVCKTEAVAMVAAMAVKVGKEAVVAFMEIWGVHIPFPQCHVSPKE